LFAARTDVYATRWENARTDKAGWLPAVRGGWRNDIRHEDRDYLPLSKDVLPAQLPGDVHAGLYPLLEGDLCWWLAADFDGPMAMLDALAYLKAVLAGKGILVLLALPSPTDSDLGRTASPGGRQDPCPAQRNQRVVSTEWFLMARRTKQQHKPQIRASKVRIQDVRHDPPDAHKIAKVLVEIASGLDSNLNQDPTVPTQVLVSTLRYRRQPQTQMNPLRAADLRFPSAPGVHL
jgi:hypothetical protein